MAKLIILELKDFYFKNNKGVKPMSDLKLSIDVTKISLLQSVK